MTVLNEAIMVLSIFAIGMAILMYIFDKLDNKWSSKKIIMFLRPFFEALHENKSCLPKLVFYST